MANKDSTRGKVNILTPTKCKNAKPSDRRLNDGGGLYLVINANGSADKVRDACMRADFMGEREVLMQAWADYLDVCRDASGKVVDIKSKRNTA